MADNQQLDVIALMAARKAAQAEADRIMAQAEEQRPQIMEAVAVEAEALAKWGAERAEALEAFQAEWAQTKPTNEATETALALGWLPSPAEATATATGRTSRFDAEHARTWLAENADRTDAKGRKILSLMYDCERTYRNETGASVNHDAFNELRLAQLNG